VATRLDTVIPCLLAISWNPSQNASSRLTLVLSPSNLTSLLMDADFIEGLVGRSVLIFDQPCRSRRIRVLDLDPIGRERTRKVNHKASISSLHYPDGDIRAAVPGCDCSPALTASVRVVRWRASTTHRPPPAFSTWTSSRTQLHWRGLSSTTSANAAAALRQSALKMLSIIRRTGARPTRPLCGLKC
jgi:hypothetical protein